MPLLAPNFSWASFGCLRRSKRRLEATCDQSRSSDDKTAIATATAEVWPRLSPLPVNWCVSLPPSRRGHLLQIAPLRLRNPHSCASREGATGDGREIGIKQGATNRGGGIPREPHQRLLRDSLTPSDDVAADAIAKVANDKARATEMVQRYSLFDGQKAQDYSLHVSEQRGGHRVDVHT